MLLNEMICKKINKPKRKDAGVDREESGSYNQCMTKKVQVETEKKLCINCDNKHGCKSGTPPCIGEMKKNNIIGWSGKQYLFELNKTYRCKKCPFFRSCWTMEEYNLIH